MVHQQRKTGFSPFPDQIWMTFLVIVLLFIPALPVESMAETPIQSAVEVDYPPFSKVDPLNGTTD
jgi:hypothetical protein